MIIKTFSSPTYSIVGDGGISSPRLGEGRFIPAIIIDAEPGSNISDLIKLHQETRAGDVEVSWGRPLDFSYSKYVILTVEYKKPMTFEFRIAFEIKKQYSLVDGIIQSRGFYLQTGDVNDKVSNMSIDKILVEVPELGFDKKWDKILLDTLTSLYKKKGKSKSDAKHLAIQQKRGMREMWNIRRS